MNRSALTLLLLLSATPCAGAQEKPAISPQAQALAAFTKDASGVWSLATDTFAGRVEDSKLLDALGRCAKRPFAVSARQLGELRKALGGDKMSATTVQNVFRGDLVYHPVGDKLVRIDYRAKGFATVGGVEKRQGGSGRSFYDVQVERFAFKVAFDTLKAKTAPYRFMVQNRALYIKCPPVPPR